MGFISSWVRFRVQGSGFTGPRSRFTVHGPRSTVHGYGSRTTVHGLRITDHVSPPRRRRPEWSLACNGDRGSSAGTVDLIGSPGKPTHMEVRTMANSTNLNGKRVA